MGGVDGDSDGGAGGIPPRRLSESRKLSKEAGARCIEVAGECNGAGKRQDPVGRESSRRTVYLVSCVKKKRPKCSRAKDLYVSDWFIKARRFVESAGCPWRILSAKYGLVSPEQVIAPYEKTLKAMLAAERRQWAENVDAQIAKSLPDVERVVFLAGQPYREYLAARLERRDIDVEVPMESLRMGEQLSWLGAMSINRRASLARFHELLTRLKRNVGGKRRLADCHGRMGWPERGVYFFFEPGEVRADSGDGPRVVRVGTHALKAGSRATLWGRLSQHRGSGCGGGNHRGSIFRLLVGTALIERDGLQQFPAWGVGSDPGKAAACFGLGRRELKRQEEPLERRASGHIGAMPFLWLEIDDPPGQESDRGVIERNSIALLSNYQRDPLDPPSDVWLGQWCDREKVRGAGLWNNNHVDERITWTNGMIRPSCP